MPSVYKRMTGVDGSEPIPSIENDDLPLVSIDCITYNHAPYLRQCLEGIMMQKTDFSFEVLIHDDASTDGTQDIIREYEAMYPDVIRPIYQTENQYSKGLSISRTFNFPRARGRYVALCEGDDYWIDPYKLQKQVDFLESHPDYSMCFHNAEIEYETEDTGGFKHILVENREYSTSEVFDNWIVPTASMVFRREVPDCMLNDSRIINGDINCVMASAHSGRIYAMSESMSVYRVHGNGLTQQRRSNFSESYYLRALDHYRALYEGYPELSYFSYSRKAVHVHVSLASYYKSEKKYALMNRHLLKAFFINPFRMVLRVWTSLMTGK